MILDGESLQCPVYIELTHVVFMEMKNGIEEDSVETFV